jgi:hypothetical protein
MNATGWSRGLEVTGGGTGVVSHAGLVLLRQLADRTGPACQRRCRRRWAGMTGAACCRTLHARSRTGRG